MAAIDQLNGLLTLINSTSDQKKTTTTSGGSQTTQTNVSDQGVKQIIDQILSGSGGVKSIGNRARSSGLYNSTSEDILLGNLYAEAANKAELARTPTVTTTAPTASTVTVPGTSKKDIATGLGGAFLASQALNIGAKALTPAIEAGGNYVTDLLSGLFGNGSSGGTSSNKGLSVNDDASGGSIGDVNFGGFGGFGGQVGNGSTGITTGEGYGLNTSTLKGFNTSSADDQAVGLNFGFNSDTGGTSVGVGGLGALGGVLNSIVSGLGGGGGKGGNVSGGNGTSGGSVICTALKDQGLLDIELHAAGAKYLNAMDPITVIGYQVWGNKIADKIREGHKGWIKVALPVATSRTALLATRGTIRDHLKYPLGTITKFIGEPLCNVIGLFVPEATFDKLSEAYYNQRGN